MDAKCLVGKHDWDGCVCASCGRFRDEGHDWDGCRCRKCGKVGTHDWDGCVCRHCGFVQPEYAGGHDWDGCVCRKCGTRKHVLDDAHDWNGCTCRKCGARRKTGHIAGDDCRCTVCGETAHDWVEETEEFADEEQFDALGGGLENMWMMHQMRPVWSCRKCGAREYAKPEEFGSSK